MHDRIEALRTAVLDAPHGARDVDELVRLYIDARLWNDLYAFFGDLAERVSGREPCLPLWRALAGALADHAAAAADDHRLAAELLLRAGDIHREQLAEPLTALRLYRDAYERLPGVPALDRARALFEAHDDSDVLRQLWDLRAALCDDPAERKTAWLEAAELCLRGEDVGGAEQRLEQAAALDPDDRDVAERLADIKSFRASQVDEVERLRDALAATPPDSPDSLELRRDLGNLLLRDPAGAAEAAGLLAPVFAVTPDDTLLGFAVLDAQRRAGLFAEAVSLGAAWLARETDRAVRGRLQRLLAELHGGPLHDPEAALTFLRDAYRDDPRDQTLRATLVAQLRETGRWADLSAVYEDARRAARDKDEERQIQLELANTLWHEAGDYHAAEEAFRRLRGYPAAADTINAFYEAFYEHQADWRRLFALLAQRQTTADMAERVALGVRMARLAEGPMAEPDKAVEAWRRVLSWEPDHREAIRALTELYRANGNWTALLEFLSGRVSRLADDRADEKVALLEDIAAVYADPKKLPDPMMEMLTYRRILQLAPGHPAAGAALARGLEASGQWTELVKWLEQRADALTDPAERTAVLKRVATLARDQLRNPNRAVKPLETVLQLDPHDLEAIDALRDICRAKHNLERLYELTLQSLDLTQGDDRAARLYDAAELATDRLHRPDEAVPLWEALLQHRQSDERAFESLSRLYTRLGFWDRYVALVQGQLETLPAGPERRTVQCRLGEVLFDRLREHDRARALFLAVLEEDPDNAVARAYLQKIHVYRRDWNELQALYARSGDWNGYITALADLADAEEDPETKVQIHLQIGRIYEEKLDDAVRALKWFERAFDVNPAHLETIRTLVTHYRVRQQPERLLDVLTALVSYAEEPAEQRAAIAELVALSDAAGETEQAFDWCVRALHHDLARGELSALDDIEARARRAGALSRLADVYTDAEAAAESEFVRVAVLRRLGTLYKEQLHDFPRAIEVFRRAQDVDPGDVEVLKALEELYYATSDFEGLEDVLVRRVDLARDFQVIREATIKLGQLYEDIIEDPAKAIEAYRRLLDADARDREAIAGLKRVFEREERFDDLADILETEVGLLEPGAERLALLQQIGSLQRVQRHDPDAAVDAFARALADDPDFAPAFASLESLFDEGTLRERIAPLIEVRYRRHEQWERLAEAIEVRLDASDVADEQAGFLRELAQLAETRLDDPERAFGALVRVFRLQPADERVWQELERLAEALANWEGVADLYAAALGFEQAADLEVSPLIDRAIERKLTLRLAAIDEEALDNGPAAVACYRRILDADPRDTLALDALERLYGRLGDHENLLDVLQRKADIAPDAAERKARLLQVCALLQQPLDRPGEAANVYRQVLDVDPRDLDVIERLEVLFEKLERFDDLVALLRQKHDVQGDAAAQAATLVRLGNVLRDRLGDVHQAIDAFERALPNEQVRPAALDALAALLGLTEMAGYDDFAPRVLDLLIPIYDAAGDGSVLVSLYEVRLRLTSDAFDQAQIHQTIARIAADRLADPALAFEEWAKAFELQPADEALLASLDLAARALAAWTRYAEVLEGAIAGVDPFVAQRLIARLAALYYDELGDPDQAIRWYERLRAEDPDHPAALEALDALYDLTARTAERVAVVERRAELAVDGEEKQRLHFLAGTLHLELGAADLAIEAFRVVVQTAGDRQAALVSEAYDHLERLLDEQARHDDLVQLLLERAHGEPAVAPRRERLLRAAAVYEERLDAPHEAIGLYQGLLASEPGNADVRAALRRLLQATEQWSELETLLLRDVDTAADPAERRATLLRLGHLYAENFSDARRAAGCFTRVLTEDPRDEAALVALRGMLDDQDEGLGVAQALLSAYQQTGDERHVAEMLRFQVDRYADHIDAGAALRNLAALHEASFADPRAAFDCYAEAFTVDYRDEAAFAALQRLAAATERFEDFFTTVNGVLDAVVEPDTRVRLQTVVADTLETACGDLARAEKVYCDILDAEPAHSLSLARLERIYERAERWDALADILRRKSELHGELAERVATLKRLGALLQEMLEQPEEAAQVFQQVLTIAPSDAEAFERLEAIFHTLSDWTALVDVLERKLGVLERTDDRVDVFHRLANTFYFNIEDRDGALETLARLLEERPDDEDAVELLEAIHAEGHAQERIGRLLEPHYLHRGAFEKLVALYRVDTGDDADPELRWQRLNQILALQTERLDDRAGAFDTLRQLTALRPDESGLIERLAELAEALGNFQEFCDHLGAIAADALDQRLAVTLILRRAAVTETSLNAPAAAIDLYRDVLERDPAQADAAQALERLLTAGGRFRELVEHFRARAEHAPSSVEAVAAHFAAADVLVARLEARDEAAAELERVLDIDGGNREAFGRLETLLQQVSAAERLDDLYRRWSAVAAEPERSDILHRLAVLQLEQLHDYAAALDLFRTLLSARPPHGDSLLYLEAIIESVPDDAAGEQFRSDVLDLVEPTYDERTPAEKWVVLLMVRLDQAGDGLGRAELLSRLGALYRDRLNEPATAFDFYARALLLDFGNADIDAALTALAEATDAFEALLGLYDEGLAGPAGEGAMGDLYLLKAARLCRDRLRDPERAAGYFARVLERDPACLEALDALERHRREVSDFIGLTEVIERRLDLVQSDEERLERLLTLAQLWEEQLDNHEDAIRWYEEAHNLRPADPRALAQLARLRRGAGEWPELLDVYERMLALAGDAATRIGLFLQLAELHETQLESPQRAIEALRGALALDPANLPALTGLERLYSALDDWPGLRATLQQRRDLASDPLERAAFDSRLGHLAYGPLHEPELALHHFRLVLEAIPDDDEAVTALELLVDHDALRPAAAALLDPIYVRRGAHPALIALLQRLADDEAEPAARIPILYRVAALQAEALALPADAFATLAAALAAKPDEADTRARMAALAESSGAWPLLVNALESVVPAVDDSAERRALSLWLAELYEERLSDAESAIERYRDVLVTDDLNAAALRALDRLLERTGRYEDLAEVLQREILGQGGTSSVALRFRLAQLRETRLDQVDVALEIYRDILWEEPQHADSLARLEAHAREGELRQRAIDVLEPILRQAQDWTRLAWVTEQQYEVLEAGAGRAQTAQAVAEIYERRLQQPRAAFEWLGRAFLESDASAEGLLSDLERLAAAEDLWQPLADVFERKTEQAIEPELARELHMRLGLLYGDRLKDLAHAVTHLQGVLAADPENVEALRLLETGHETLEQWDALVDVCERRAALVVDPTERKALYLKIARVSEARDDDARAVSAYQRVLDVDSLDATALEHLEIHYEMLERFDDLVDILGRRAEVAGDPAQVAALKVRLAAVLEQRLGRPVEALAALEDAISLDPGRGEALDGLERLYAAERRFDDLRRLIERRVESTQDAARAVAWLLRLAHIDQHELNDSAAAIRDYQRVLEWAPDNAEALLALTQLFADAQRWVPLVDVLRARIETTGDAEARRELRVQLAGVLEARLTDFEGAASQLREVLAEAPTYVPALMGLARIRESLADWPEALEMYRQLLPQCRSDAERVASLCRLAHISLKAIGDGDGARAFLDEARELAPRDPAVLELLQDVLEKGDDVPGLVEVLEARTEQVQTGPEKAALALRIATLARERLDDSARFEQWLKTAHRHAPQNIDIGTQLARHLEQTEAFDELAPVLEALVSAYGERRDFRSLAQNAHRLGGVYERLGRADQALKSYQLSRQHDASNIDNLKALARLLFERQAWDDALKLYQAMLLQQQLFSEDDKAELFVRLAEACLALGDKKRARQYLTRLQRSNAAHPRAKELLERVGDD